MDQALETLTIDKTWLLTSDLQELTGPGAVCSMHIWSLSQGNFCRGEKAFEQPLQVVSLMAQGQDSSQGDLGNQSLGVREPGVWGMRIAVPTAVQGSGNLGLLPMLHG